MLVALVGLTLTLTVVFLPFNNVTDFLLNETLVTFFTVGFVGLVGSALGFTFTLNVSI